MKVFSPAVHISNSRNFMQIQVRCNASDYQQFNTKIITSVIGKNVISSSEKEQELNAKNYEIFLLEKKQ